MTIFKNLILLGLLGAVLLCTGCASSPKMRVIETGQELAIVQNSEAGELEVITANDAAAQGAMAGAGAGIATGAMTGLTCGPFAPACVPLAGLTFGAVGAIGGSIIAAATGLNDEDEAAILSQLDAYLESEDANSAFRQQLSDRLDTRWDVVTESKNELGVALTQIALRGEAGGKVKLVIRAEAYAIACEGCSKSRRVDAAFVHASRGISAEEWIANDYDFVKSELHLAFSGLASDIDAALAKP